MTSRELTARNWPASEGPAERLLTQGPDAAPGPGARTVLNAPGRVRDYLRLSFGRIGHEVFTVLLLFLDAQQRLIACEELFRRTLTQTSVYPREVVRRALTLNCASVILSPCRRPISRP